MASAWKKLKLDQMPKSLLNWTVPYADTIESLKGRIEELLKEKRVDPDSDKWTERVLQASMEGKGKGTRRGGSSAVATGTSDNDADIIKLLMVRLAIHSELEKKRRSRGVKEEPQSEEGGEK